MDKILIEAKSEKDKLFSDMKTIILSTISDKGELNVSYAPAVLGSEGELYIYISRLSKHTSNLMSHPNLSIMIIEDESKSEHIFARKRFTMDAKSEIIDRDSDKWNKIIDLMEAKFGDTIKTLKDMSDFYMFQLTPLKGLLVYGFGRAFHFTKDDLEQPKHINDKGHSRVTNKN